MSVERAEGLKAVFRCQYQEEGLIVHYNWLVNNSGVREDTATVRERPPLSHGRPATLTIMATPQHNNSIVHCLAIIRNGTVRVGNEVSTTATLIIHGELVTFYMHDHC